MTTKYFFAIPLLVFCVLCAPPKDNSETPYPQLICRKCDDDVHGCRAEVVTTEICQIGTTGCMVEMFFIPNATRKFNFRAGCAARHSCPPGYTKLMCTDFINGVKTCRLCCFENECHDPTPRSEMRIKVMRDSLLQAGFDSNELDIHLARENEIAFNRGRKTFVTSRITTLGYDGKSTSKPEKKVSELEDLMKDTEIEEDPESIMHEQEVFTDLKLQTTELFDSTTYSLTTAADESQENHQPVLNKESSTLKPSTQNSNTKEVITEWKETTQPPTTDPTMLIEEEKKLMKSPTLNVNTVVQDGKKLTSDTNSIARTDLNKEQRMGSKSKVEHINDQALGNERSRNVPAAVNFKNSGISVSKGVVVIALAILFPSFLLRMSV